MESIKIRTSKKISSLKGNVGCVCVCVRVSEEKARWDRWMEGQREFFSLPGNWSE